MMCGRNGIHTWDAVTTKPIAHTTYRTALADNPYAFALIPGWLARTAFVSPLAEIH